MHIVLLKCQIAFLKFTSSDNRALVGCIPIPAVAVHLKLKSYKISQSSHKMYSNNILNFQVSSPILNACTKKSGNLLKAPRMSTIDYLQDHTNRYQGLLWSQFYLKYFFKRIKNISFLFQKKTYALATSSFLISTTSHDFKENNYSISPFFRFFLIRHILWKVITFSWYLIWSETRGQNPTNRRVNGLTFSNADFNSISLVYLRVQSQSLCTTTSMNFLFVHWLFLDTNLNNWISFVRKPDNLLSLTSNCTHIKQYMQAIRQLFYTYTNILP